MTQTSQILHLGISWIKSWLSRRQVLLLRIRFIRVSSFFYSLGNAGGVPFGVLDLLLCFRIRRAPDVDKIEKSQSRIKGTGRLLRDLICLDDSLSPIQSLLSELLEISLGGGIVDDRILAGIFVFGLQATPIVSFVPSSHSFAQN